MLLFFGGGEEHVVEYQAVTGGVREQVEVCGRVVDQMLVVLGVVAGIERPGALAVFAVDVASLVEEGAFSHDGHRRLDVRYLDTVSKSSCCRSAFLGDDRQHIRPVLK